MTAILKGFVIVSVLFCLLSSSNAQKGIQTDKIQKPFVLNANDVPVLGGLLNIYGLNFGNDPKVISVYIYDTPASSSNNESHKIECADVKIVLPNSIISCIVFEIGTGRSKHIEVTVNGISNANTDDVNIAFSRSAPMLNSITYDENSVIRVYGRHFGFNPSLVCVTVGGYEHPVVAVNDSVITCEKHADFQLPTDGNASAMYVLVMVDNQQTEASMSLVMEEESSNFVEEKKFDDSSEDSSFSAIFKDNTKTIVIAVIPGAAGVMILIGFLIIRRRMNSSSTITTTGSSPITTGNDTEKADSHAIITGGLVRDSSMEEIDLASDTDASRAARASVLVMGANVKETPLKKSSSGMQSPTIYELNRAVSSSSESSFSSPYSSVNTTPSFITPESMRRGAADRSSPAFDMSDFSTTTHSNRRSRREANFMMGEPISRLGKRSMDSAKQSAFDSPMRTPFDTPTRTPTRSPSGTPTRNPNGTPDFPGAQEYAHAGSGHPLHTSQEINQLHKNPFDSPSTLHLAIQRAALLRSQQHPQPQHHNHHHQHHQHQHRRKHASPMALRKKGKPITANRRASLAVGAHPPHLVTARRSSLGTISLHASHLRKSTSTSDYDVSSTDDDNDEGSDNGYNGGDNDDVNDDVHDVNTIQQQQQLQPSSLRSSQLVRRIDEASDE
jgi:hypothetical protein